MLTTYRRILAVPGALLFSATGLVARLPISMQGLGIVLLVVSVTGSYGYAGAVAGATTVASAAATVLQGRYLDRLGQARVLPPLILAWGLALGMLVVAVNGEWPRWAAFALAVVAGAALPPVGTCVRARWSHVLDDPRQVQTGYALESVVDEAVFITGPILVTALATSWDPVAGLAAAVLATLLVGASRLTLRLLPELQGHRLHRQRVLVVGAGAAGRGLARELRESHEARVVGFLDDNPRVRRRRILGISVVGSLDEAERAIASTRPDEVLVTIPAAAQERLDAVVRASESAGIPCRIVHRRTEFSAPEPVEASLS